MNNNATDWKEVASEIILIIHNAQSFNKLGETKQVHESIERAKAKYAAALKNEKENHEKYPRSS